MAWLKAGHRVPNLRFRRQSKYRECGLLAALFDLIASRLFGMERQLGVNVGCPLRPGLLTYRSILGKSRDGSSATISVHRSWLLPFVADMGAGMNPRPFCYVSLSRIFSIPAGKFCTVRFARPAGFGGPVRREMQRV